MAGLDDEDIQVQFSEEPVIKVLTREWQKK